MESSSLGCRARRNHPGVRMRDYACQEQRDGILALAKEKKRLSTCSQEQNTSAEVATGKGQGKQSPRPTSR